MNQNMVGNSYKENEMKLTAIIIGTALAISVLGHWIFQKLVRNKKESS